VTVLVTYWSGTGNTAFVGRKLAEEIEARGHTVELVPIDRLSPHDPFRYELTVLGFPVYACDAPLPVYQFLTEAATTGLPEPSAGRPGAAAVRPEISARSLLLYATKGYFAGNALRRVARAAAPAFSVRGGVSIRMPGSDGLIYSRQGGWYHRRSLARYYDNLRGIHTLGELADRLATPGNPPGGGHGRSGKRLPFSFAGLLLDPVILLVYRKLEDLLRRSFRADERCIGCRRCERVCPTGAVTVTRTADGSAPSVSFDGRCIVCLRCITQCPSEAIQLGAGSEGTVRWRGPDGTFDPLHE
jgi:NAD-dependent dihydropyrimidine dehydrogenase PreA subunit